MKKTALAAVAVATAAGLALSGCASGGSGSGSASGDQKIDHLKIGNFLDVTSWDPANADIGFDGPYLSAVYDPLVRIDADGNPKPALAKSWDYSKDRKTLTMHLRSGVKFSDGEKFDAQAAVTNIEHLEKGTLAGDAYTDVSSVKAVNDDTLKITLDKRDDSLLYLMGSGRSWMAAPKAIASGKLDTTPVGSGPYTLDKKTSTAGSVYNFTKVKDQWASKTFPFKEVTIYPIGDATARNNAMLSGQTNVTYGLAKDLATAKKQNWKIWKKVGSWVGLQFVDRTGTTVPALGKTKVRQAINYAFDGAQILKSIGEGVGVATNQVFPTDGDINDSKLDTMYKTNIAKAKKLMKEAGYADGFSVKMPMSPIFQTWQAVTAQTLKKIGIKVHWVNMQQPDYQAKAGTYPMFIAVLALDSDSATVVDRQVVSKQWYNQRQEYTKFPKVKALVEKVQTTKGDAQTAAIKDLNTELTKLAWFDVWYQSDNLYFTKPGIKVTPVTGLMFPTLNFITQD